MPLVHHCSWASRTFWVQILRQGSVGEPDPWSDFGYGGFAHATPRLPQQLLHLQALAEEIPWSSKPEQAVMDWLSYTAWLTSDDQA